MNAMGDESNLNHPPSNTLKTKKDQDPFKRKLLVAASLIAAAAVGALVSTQLNSGEETVSNVDPETGTKSDAVDLARSIDVPIVQEKDTVEEGDSARRKQLEGRHEEVRLGLSWEAEPAMLRVYQATEVRLRVIEKPEGHPDATCEWVIDGTSKRGCDTIHTFEGGLADARVKLRLMDRDWSHESTRIIPLERLEVVEGLESESLSSAEIPDAMRDERSFRFAVIADSASQGGVSSDVRRAVSALSGTVRPDLVFHLGGIVAPDEGKLGWDKADEAIASPVRKAGIHMLWGMSRTDIREEPRVRRPEIELIDGQDYPFRYTFSYKGAFFLCFSVKDDDGADEATLRWLKRTLEKAKIYDSRFVLSYLPLNKFTETHLGSHKKKMRLYEILLRSRVTAFFTGAYRVYFKGRYGVLDVRSTGALAGAGGKLAGTNLAQRSSFTVVDIRDGSVKRTFAVEGPDFDQTFDESLLPDSVEVYSR